LAAGETCVRDAGAPGASGLGCAAPAPNELRFHEPPGVVAAGDFNLRLAAPGDGNQGSVTVTAAVPDWLEYDWNTAVPGDEDPSGQATFGVFGGEARQIYTREVY
jgi:MSHA biogenesis protein MshQ